MNRHLESAKPRGSTFQFIRQVKQKHPIKERGFVTDFAFWRFSSMSISHQCGCQYSSEKIKTNSRLKKQLSADNNMLYPYAMSPLSGHRMQNVNIKRNQLKCSIFSFKIYIKVFFLLTRFGAKLHLMTRLLLETDT